MHQSVTEGNIVRRQPATSRPSTLRLGLRKAVAASASSGLGLISPAAPCSSLLYCAKYFVWQSRWPSLSGRLAVDGLKRQYVAITSAVVLDIGVGRYRGLSGRKPDPG
jgi:hypothetical protein